MNQARTSKINDSRNIAYQHVFGRNPPRMEDAIQECGEADQGIVSWRQTGKLTQVRSFTENEEAAHGHITDHMRNLGERLLHAGDLSYEDITGQDGPHVDSPTVPEGNTAARHQKPHGKGQMDVDPESQRRMRGKDRLIGSEQPLAPTADTSSDTTQQERQKKIMTTRGDELTNPKQQFSKQLRMKFWYSALRRMIWSPEMMRSRSILHCLRRK